MDAFQAAAILRRRGVNWPHVSPSDRIALEIDEPDAMGALLGSVPDDSIIRLVVTMDEKTGESTETKDVSNPNPAYKRLGFASRSALDAKVTDLKKNLKKKVAGGKA
jgi:hypothetical protein